MKANLKQNVLNLLLAGLFILLSALLLSLSRWQPGQLRMYRLALFIAWTLTPFLVVFILSRRQHLKPSISVLSLLSLWFVFWMMECVFLFVSESHGHIPTLAHHNWYRNYSAQFNSYGYRDREPMNENRQGRPRIFFLGDSFTEGAGIEDPAARFPDIFCSSCNESGQCFNLGRAGSDSRAQRQMLLEYPLSPDKVILAWVPNDILHAAEDKGYTYATGDPYASLSPVPAWIISHSYFLDYLYWHVHREQDAAWIAFNEKIFADTAVVAAHMEDLNALRMACAQKGGDLFVLLFPYLDITDASLPWAKTIARGLDSIGIANYIPEKEILSLPRQSRVVNPHDPHPSKELNRRIAGLLCQWPGIIPK